MNFFFFLHWANSLIMGLGLQIPLAAGYERCYISQEEVSFLPNPKHGGPGPHIYDPYGRVAQLYP